MDELSHKNDAVAIEPLTPDYFGLAAEWLSDPVRTRQLASFWRNKTFEPRHIAVVNMNPRIKLFLVRYLGEPCGLVGLTNIDFVDRSCSVMGLVGRDDLRGHRINTRAVRHALKYAFEVLGLGSAYSSYMSTNHASERSTERTGWRRVGALRKGFCSQGAMLDRVVIDILPCDIETPPRIGAIDDESYASR